MPNVDATLEELPILTGPSEAYLNPRQRRDYRAEREACFSWLLTFGKAPVEADGYAVETVKPRGYRMDLFYRWVWEQEGGYTATVTPEHADAWMDHLARQDTSNAHKSNCQKAVKMLIKWRHHEHGLATWSPTISFSDDRSQPRDYLTRAERQAIREAALGYGTVPAYDNVTPPSGTAGGGTWHSASRSQNARSRRPTGTGRTAGRSPAWSG